MIIAQMSHENMIKEMPRIRKYSCFMNTPPPFSHYKCPDYVFGFLVKRLSLLSFLSWYLSLISFSLLKSEINNTVLPLSSTIGYLPTSDPVNSFAFGIFNRLCSIIILYSRVSFFIVRPFLDMCNVQYLTRYE